MELVLTLGSLASFFALVLAWAALPHDSARQQEARPAVRLADATR